MLYMLSTHFVAVRLSHITEMVLESIKPFQPLILYFQLNFKKAVKKFERCYNLSFCLTTKWLLAPNKMLSSSLVFKCARDGKLHTEM